MTEPTTPAPTPRKKRGPKPAADLDAVTRVGAEFRALLADTNDEGKITALRIVVDGMDYSRLAEACAELTPDQVPLATALCRALTE